MKTIIRRSFLLFLFLNIFAFAKSEIINQNVVKQSSLDKITEISNELYLKTGVSIVAHFVQNAEGGILAYENNVSSKLNSPYVLIVLSAKDQKVDIVVSTDMQKVVNKNEILNTFIIPILAAEDKNSIDTKYSAALLNGIAEIADEIADSKKIKLNSSIGSESRHFMQGLRALFYGIIFISVSIYFYMAYKRRRK